ncbi:hypothetical protein HYPSUDRAFT_196769 [Hypholoma sublateritium FD-334 SS-4]|uniref:Uncharacterized protein n=1 Tax=Hypholoma sublateritium (strain FD-334 SS-4) TaxID=945553 RepID=A0A0D2PF77_HYPSF|nr:hypothetical protein HYPSUDRAFT_196769 [Hypholoma sublateritium FD-334 SS-4]
MSLWDQTSSAEELAHPEEVEAQQAEFDNDDAELGKSEEDNQDNQDIYVCESSQTSASQHSADEPNSDASEQSDGRNYEQTQIDSARRGSEEYVPQPEEGNSDGSDLELSSSQESCAETRVGRYAERHSKSVDGSPQEDADEGANEDEDEDRERTPQPDEGPNTPPRRAQATLFDGPAPTAPLRFQTGALTPLGPYNRNSGGSRTTPVAPGTAVNPPSPVAKQKATGKNVDPLFLISSQENAPL